jgi:serine/threonine protein kinase
MESKKNTKKGCGWLRRLMNWILKSNTAHVGPEIESPEIEVWEAASRQNTSNLETAQLGTDAIAAMEPFAPTPSTTVSPTSQAITETPKLHNLSLEPTEAVDSIHELENEYWEEECIEKIMDEMTSQLMQFRKNIQAKDKIVSELKKKLDVQKHDKIEDGVENAATITNKSLTRTGGVDVTQFDFLRILGIGGFSNVFLVQKRGGEDDGRLYAMKVLRKASIIEDEVIQYTMTERNVLEAVRHHPFLTTLHYAFQTDSKLYLALDYVCGGDLLTHSYGRKLGDDDVRFYIGETILALEYLHKMGIIHRDVKLENILLDLDGHAVLSDFGLSRMFLPNELRKTYSRCGTLKYMAPEVIRTNDGGYDMAADWWSLGIVTYKLLTGVAPFERRRESETDEELARRTITEEPYIPDDLSFDAADFISKLLVKDPRKRLGGGKDDSEELKMHPFLKGINWSDLAQRKVLAPFSPIKKNELDDSNVSEEFAHSPATLLPGCDEIFRGYSYVSPSLCSEYVVSGEQFQPTAETCPNSADAFYRLYNRRIEYLEKELSEVKRIQMTSNMEKTRLELDLRAAIEKIESLEAELIQLNCVQK